MGEAVRLSLRRKLYLLYMMNVSDWICTAVLLRSGRFSEANPLAVGVMNSLSLGFLIKVMLSAAVIWLVYRLIERLDDSGLATADSAVSFTLVIYSSIHIVHAVNFLILFFG